MCAETVVEGSAVVEDERLAAGSSAKVLISASTSSAFEAIAYRIHRRGSRSRSPFISINASDLPTDGALLRAACVRLGEAARGGTVLLKDVERMPRLVQDRLIALLDELESAGEFDAFRVLSGTTVLLFDHVAAGVFSEPLFYRLNVLHLHSSPPLVDIREESH